jgi:hypothetical protein
LIETNTELEIYGVVVIDAITSLPLYSRLSGVEPSLFSGFIGAILSYSDALLLGELASFATDEKAIYIVNGTKVKVAIVTSTKTDAERIANLARRIIIEFESLYELESTAEVSAFYSFEKTLNHLLLET